MLETYENWNNDVLMNTEGILDVIRVALSPTLSRELAIVHSSLYRRGRGGRSVLTDEFSAQTELGL